MKEYGHRVRPPMEGETMAGVESRIGAPLDKLEPLLPKRIKALHIDELTSGIIRSEDSQFIINLEDQTFEVIDDNGYVRVAAGLLGGLFGLRLKNASDVELLDSTSGNLEVTGLVTTQVLSTGHLTVKCASASQVFIMEGASTVAQFESDLSQIQATEVRLLGAATTNLSLTDGLGILSPTDLRLHCTTFSVFSNDAGAGQAAALATIESGAINSGDATTDTVIANLRTVVNAMRTALTNWKYFAT